MAGISYKKRQARIWQLVAEFKRIFRRKLGASADLLCKAGVHSEMLQDSAEKTASLSSAKETRSGKAERSEDYKKTDKAQNIYRASYFRQKVVTAGFAE